MSIAHIAAKEAFQTEVLEAAETVLLDFWAVWCGPCRMIAPILEDVAAERTDIKVCKIDVDEAGDLAALFGIASIPTLVVMKNGKETARSVGVVSKAKILSML